MLLENCALQTFKERPILDKLVLLDIPEVEVIKCLKVNIKKERSNLKKKLLVTELCAPQTDDIESLTPNMTIFAERVFRR